MTSCSLTKALISEKPYQNITTLTTVLQEDIKVCLFLCHVLNSGIPLGKRGKYIRRQFVSLHFQGHSLDYFVLNVDGHSRSAYLYNFSVHSTQANQGTYVSHCFSFFLVFSHRKYPQYIVRGLNHIIHTFFLATVLTCRCKTQNHASDEEFRN